MNSSNWKKSKKRPPPRKEWWESPDASTFKRSKIIGKGTYGEVWKAVDPSTKKEVALKKILLEKTSADHGFSTIAIREIKILKCLKHENICMLRHVVTNRATANNRYRGSIYLVFDYMDYDLTGLIDSKDFILTAKYVKSFAWQLLDALSYIHSNNIVHRDLKGANILVNKKGVIKLADFGLARRYCSGKDLTARVVTLWYRPPELFLLGHNEKGFFKGCGTKIYNAKAVDMWSFGCILAEMCTGKPILTGSNDLTQLQLIFDLLGTPTTSDWETYYSMGVMYEQPPVRKISKLRDKLKNINKFAYQLISQCLVFDPSKRCTAGLALLHDYFEIDRPRVHKPGELPEIILKQGGHEYEAIQLNQKRKELAEKKKKQLRKVKARQGITGKGKRSAMNFSMFAGGKNAISQKN